MAKAVAALPHSKARPPVRATESLMDRPHLNFLKNGPIYAVTDRFHGRCLAWVCLAPNPCICLLQRMLDLLGLFRLHPSARNPPTSASPKTLIGRSHIGMSFLFKDIPAFVRFRLPLAPPVTLPPTRTPGGSLFLSCGPVRTCFLRLGPYAISCLKQAFPC